MEGNINTGKQGNNVVQNRRKFSRLPFSARITVTMNDVIIGDTRCKNISHGGMCFVINDRVDAINNGMIILVHKCDNDITFFKANFAVSWNQVVSHDKHAIELGVNFEGLDTENKKALSRILFYESTAAN